MYVYNYKASYCVIDVKRVYEKYCGKEERTRRTSQRGWLREQGFGERVTFFFFF